jgi:predicted alpha/beta superfamily hydrolase
MPRLLRLLRRSASAGLLGVGVAACGEGDGGVLPADSSRVESFGITLPQLGGRERTIHVYLPKGYPGRGVYPVLYLQDGQVLFTPTSFGDWRVDETLDSLADAGSARGMIVVGIVSSPFRWDEYGPWVNHHVHAWIDPALAGPVQGGEGAAYLDFLVNTLKPEIDRRYRTARDAQHTGIGGSSMGGLIALYAGLARPDVFGRVLAMSTAVWFAEGGGAWLAQNRLLAHIRQHAPPRDVRFYLDVGTDERSRATDPDVVDAQGQPVTYPRAYLEGTQAVADALAAGGVPAANLRLVVEQGGIHHETAWSRRFGPAVQWLFD